MSNEVGQGHIDVKVRLDQVQFNKELLRLQRNRISLPVDIDSKAILARRAQMRAIGDTLAKEFTQPMQRRIVQAHKDIASSIERDTQLHQAYERAGQKASQAFVKDMDSVFKHAVKQGLHGIAPADTDVDQHRWRRFGEKAGIQVREGVFSIMTLLPARLEGLFRSPAGTAIGLALAGVLVVGFELAMAQIAALLVAGVGMAGIGAGIIAVAKDARVSKAFADLGNHVVEKLQIAATVFIPQLVRAAGVFKTTFDILLPSIQRVFRGLAPYVTPLAGGFASFLLRLAPALERAAMAARPLISLFVNVALPLWADKIGNLFDRITAQGPELNAAFRLFIVLIGAAIDGIGGLLANSLKFMRVMASIFITVARTYAGMLDAILSLDNAIGHDIVLTSKHREKLTQTSDKMKDMANNTQNAFKSQTLFGMSLDNVNFKLEDTKTETEKLAEATNNLERQWREALDPAINLDQAVLHYKESLLRLREQITGTTSSLSTNTLAGIQNRRSVQDLASGLVDLTIKEFATGKSIDAVKASHDRRLVALRKELTQMGFNKKEIDDILQRYAAWPKNLSTNFQVTNVKTVSGELDKLLIKQEALRTGTDISTASKVLKRNLAKNMATGGFLQGPGTGTSDSIPINASDGEYILNARAVRQIGVGNLDAMNRMGFAKGGAIGGQYNQNPGGSMLFKVATSMTKIDPHWLDMFQSFGGGPGQWKQMWNWVHSRFPFTSLGSGYRPGDPKYHGRGWAIDIVTPDVLSGGPKAFSVFNAIKSAFRPSILELIYDFARGNAVWNGNNHLFTGPDAGPGTHSDHIHWAQRPGGIAGFGAAVAGAGASRWAGVASSVLKELGLYSPSNLRGLLASVQQESGGNPNAINTYDINAQRGDPSIGLNQVIGSTFRAHAGKYRSRGQYDPYANLYASVRYASSRYGAGWAARMAAPGGYDNGGPWPSGTMGFNSSGRTEMVLNSSQADALESRIAHESDVYVTVKVGDEIIIEKVKAVVDGNNNAVASAFRRGRG